jgi:vitamin B12 transporter
LAENLFAFGNPDLLPEQSKGWDVGATQHLFDNRLTFDATYFRNDFVDLIVFDFNTFSLENVGRARASGVEVTGEWLPLDKTRLYANYTLTDTLDQATGNELLRRPRDKAAVGVEQYFGDRHVRLAAQLLYVGDRLDTNNIVLDPYTLVNVNGSFYLSEQAEIFARIDNLLDERYEEIRGFGVVGLAAYAGMNFWY